MRPKMQQRQRHRSSHLFSLIFFYLHHVIDLHPRHFLFAFSFSCYSSCLFVFFFSFGASCEKIRLKKLFAKLKYNLLFNSSYTRQACRAPPESKCTRRGEALANERKIVHRKKVLRKKLPNGRAPACEWKVHSDNGDENGRERVNEHGVRGGRTINNKPSAKWKNMQNQKNAVRTETNAQYAIF